MTEDEYRQYLATFNRRDYPATVTYFADDFAMEMAGFRVAGREAFQAYYRMFHQYFHEEVDLKGFYTGADGFCVRLIIHFHGLKDLTAEFLAEQGYSGMMPMPAGARIDQEFLLWYQLDETGKIRLIRGGVVEPLRA